jgi:hypothetical protein
VLAAAAAAAMESGGGDCCCYYGGGGSSSGYGSYGGVGDGGSGWAAATSSLPTPQHLASLSHRVGSASQSLPTASIPTPLAQGTEHLPTPQHLAAFAPRNAPPPGAGLWGLGCSESVGNPSLGVDLARDTRARVCTAGASGLVFLQVPDWEIPDLQTCRLGDAGPGATGDARDRVSGSSGMGTPCISDSESQHAPAGARAAGTPRSATQRRFRLGLGGRDRV